MELFEGVVGVVAAGVVVAVGVTTVTTGVVTTGVGAGVVLAAAPLEPLFVADDAVLDDENELLIELIVV